jgi:hypothetical protein
MNTSSARNDDVPLPSTLRITLQHCIAPRKESNDHIQYCRWKDNKAKEIVTAFAALYQTRTKTATFRSKLADGSEAAALGGGAMARKRMEAPRFDEQQTVLGGGFVLKSMVAWSSQLT